MEQDILESISLPYAIKPDVSLCQIRAILVKAAPVRSRQPEDMERLQERASCRDCTGAGARYRHRKDRFHLFLLLTVSGALLIFNIP